MLSLSRPLLEYTDISFVNYSVSYRDNTRKTISTRPDWILHFHEKQYYNKAIPFFYPVWSAKEVEPPIKIQQQCFYLRNVNGYTEHHPILADARDNFNIDYPFSILLEQSGQREIFTFGTTKGNANIMNFYHNSSDVLKRFIFYFKDKGDNLIKNARTFKVPHITRRNVASDDLEQLKGKLYNSMPVRNISVEVGKHSVILKRNESLCLIEMMKGKTFKQIGETLNISTRTVESRISKVKRKLQVDSKHPLIDYVRSSNIGEVLRLAFLNDCF